LYKAYGKEEFGEYEVDYVFLCKLNTEDVKYDIVKEEISEVEWVGYTQLTNWMDQKVQ
jgi:isopentenyldiphosphate isomerase